MADRRIRITPGLWEEQAVSEPAGWQLASGSGAEASERYLMSTFGYAWTQALIQLAAPQEGDRLLDVACGTGPVARYAAPLVGSAGRVVGFDLNSGMLNTARAMPIPEGVTIEWREGDATALPFPNASFDVVCCQQGLQFFPGNESGTGERNPLAVDRRIDQHAGMKKTQPSQWNDALRCGRPDF